MTDAVTAVSNPGARTVLRRAWAKASTRVAEGHVRELATFEATLARAPRVNAAERTRITVAIAAVRSTG